MALREGYKQTEVGVIPEDWNAKPIGSEIDLLTGHPFPSSGYTMSGIRLLRGSNIKRGETDWSDDILQHWPSVTADISKYELRVGDLVIAMDGSLVGRSFAQLRESDLPALLLQRVARIRSEKLDVGYLRACISSRWFVDYVDSVKTVTAIPHISPADIRGFTVPLPERLAEQRTIATALSDVDALLESLDALITKKRNLKQAAMQQLLTGKTRLAGFDGEWEEKCLGDYVEFLRNGSNSRAELTNDDPVKYLHYGDIHASESVVLDPICLPSLPTEKAKGLDRLRNGDLIFADASEDTGGVGKSIELQAQDGIEVVAGLHTIAARFDKSVLADGFKGYLQFIPQFSKQLKRLAAGTKVYATNKSHISGIEMCLPKVEEQTAIANVLSDMDAEIEALELRRAKTRDLKQAMMQELLTGKTRLV